MFNRIYPSMFMVLSKDIREKLALDFNVGRSGPAEVRDSEVIRDGRTEEDLSVITLEKMNEYIGSEETSFERAWLVTCAKANSEINPPIGVIQGTAKTVEEVPAIIESKTETNDNTKKSK